jgi:hypothetical protein
LKSFLSFILQKKGKINEDSNIKQKMTPPIYKQWLIQKWEKFFKKNKKQKLLSAFKKQRKIDYFKKNKYLFKIINVLC